MFSKLGGTEFFLSCNFDIDKIPLKISAFHRQAFLAWTLIYKHNFSPHSYYIWNNKDVLFKRKSLFLDSWFRNNIVLINQLFDSNGTLFSYEEFCLHFNLAINRHDYTKVFGSIPSGVCMLFKNQPSITSFHRPLASPIQTFVGKICFCKQSKNNNKSIRALFQSTITTLPYVIFFWNRLSDGIMWNEVWKLPNQIYPSKDYLQSKFKLDIDTSCSFCKTSKESTIHLFWFCNIVQEFWQSLCVFISENIFKGFVLFWKYVLFGLHKNQKQFNFDNRYMINLLILMAKFHIHKSKCLGRHPSFYVFSFELVHYFPPSIYILLFLNTVLVFVYLCIQFFCKYNTIIVALFNSILYCTDV
ncbi:solute carrier family 38 (sodium-coupled neutral amino acid transporter), member 4 [Sarotherodon galilaeus]